MTITQTVDIPANRRLNFELEIPQEVTADKAYVIVQFPVPIKSRSEIKAEPKAVKKKLGMTRKDLDEFLKNAYTPHSDALLGLLSGMGEIDLDKIRMERLAKHLK